MRWTITEADRDSDGRIWITPPARTLADLLPKPEGEEEHTPRKPWRPSRLEVAGLVSGLVLAVALIAALNAFTPAPAPRSVPTPAPAATSAPTPTQAPTQAPTATPEPPTATPEPPPPTPEPQVIYVEPPCDPQNPPYQVRQQVGDLGHVVGFSCSSVEEAQANAAMLAEQMRAAAQGR
jgi:hypothetical protein